MKITFGSVSGKKEVAINVECLQVPLLLCGPVLTRVKEAVAIKRVAIKPHVSPVGSELYSLLGDIKGVLYHLAKISDIKSAQKI